MLTSIQIQISLVELKHKEGFNMSLKKLEKKKIT